MDRRRFLKGAGAAGLAAFLPKEAPGAGRERQRPNVVVFMADDLGYTDISSFGAKHIETPSIDRLGQEGMVWNNFYAGAPNCSPSRGAMLTGRCPTRIGMYSYVPPSTPMHLRESELTTAEILRSQGYQTAHVGKWHLCSDLVSGKFPVPSDHGFDYWFATENNARPSHHNPDNFVRNGKPAGKLEGYSCQLVADEAIGWLTEKSGGGNPFFLNVWFHEPHRKVAAPPDLVERHKGQRNPEYLACIENMDAAIGRVLEALEEMGVAENTFVLFTSDNGSYRKGSNDDFRGRKSFVWEGGTHVPAVMRWPGRIEPGSTCTTPAGVVDLLPTLCDISGAEQPSDRTIDGVSLAPGFEGGEISRSTPLYWFFYRTDPACAIRMGDWSLAGYLDEKVPPGHSFRPSHMEYLRRAELARFELYNLRQDPGQENNVAEQHPERLARMKEEMIAVHRDCVRAGPNWFE